MFLCRNSEKSKEKSHYEPWIHTKLQAFAHLRPVIREPYPYVGATCVDRQVEPEVNSSDEVAAKRTMAEKDSIDVYATDSVTINIAVIILPVNFNHNYIVA